MFDTFRKRPSVKLILTAAAAFTLVAGGTAFATGSTSSGTDTHQGPAAQSLLHADDSVTAEAETETADTVAAEAAKEAADAAETPEAVDPVDPAGAAQGVHGACVSKVAQDTTTVGRAHGLAVSTAAHECPKGSATVAGATKGAEKSAAARAKAAAKSAAGKAHGKS